LAFIGLVKLKSHIFGFFCKIFWILLIEVVLYSSIISFESSEELVESVNAFNNMKECWRKR